MIAVVFPGQGSQRPGMGESLYHSGSFSRQIFDQVEQATNLNVATLCFESSEETLRQTQNAQIALYTCSLAAYYALREAKSDLSVSAMAGHSVGEYAALAAAGVVSVEDGAKLVKFRGELMAKAGKSRPGTMAAVLGIEREALERVTQEVSHLGSCVVANDNCPGQLVISGDFDAVQCASALATERGAKRVLPLNVSGAFHSPLMEESAAAMGEYLAKVTFHPGSVPVYSNVTARPGTDWPKLLESQLKSLVRWTETVQNMVADGVTTFVECGSGEVLTGLLRRIDRSADGFKVTDPTTLAETLEGLADLR